MYREMITTVSLLTNVAIHNYNSFLVMRTFLSSTRSNFQGSNPALLTVVTMLRVTPPRLIFSLAVWTFGSRSAVSPRPQHFWQPPIFSLYLQTCFFFLILHVCEIIRYLSLSYFTQHNVFQLGPCCHKWQDFILFMAE